MDIIMYNHGYQQSLIMDHESNVAIWSIYAWMSITLVVNGLLCIYFYGRWLFLMWFIQIHCCQFSLFFHFNHFQCALVNLRFLKCEISVYCFPWKVLVVFTMEKDQCCGNIVLKAQCSLFIGTWVFHRNWLNPSYSVNVNGQ